MYGGYDQKRNFQLSHQKQARLAEGVNEAQAAVVMRELAAKEHKHWLHALLEVLTGSRARRRRAAAEGYRSWDR
jgi:hypothetical protein